jgi:hypothetical protein
VVDWLPGTFATYVVLLPVYTLLPVSWTVELIRHRVYGSCVVLTCRICVVLCLSLPVCLCSSSHLLLPLPPTYAIVPRTLPLYVTARFSTRGCPACPATTPAPYTCPTVTFLYPTTAVTHCSPSHTCCYLFGCAMVVLPGIVLCLPVLHDAWFAFGVAVPVLL